MNGNYNCIKLLNEDRTEFLNGITEKGNDKNKNTKL